MSGIVLNYKYEIVTYIRGGGGGGLNHFFSGNVLAPC